MTTGRKWFFLQIPPANTKGLLPAMALFSANAAVPLFLILFWLVPLQVCALAVVRAIVISIIATALIWPWRGRQHELAGIAIGIYFHPLFVLWYANLPQPDSRWFIVNLAHASQEFAASGGILIVGLNIFTADWLFRRCG